MKTNLLKSFLATVMLGSMALTASAEDAADYKPLLTDGKSWLIGTVNYNYGVPGTHHTTLSRIEVKGDTLVGGKACKKLYSYAVNKEADRSVAVAYEEDGRVYGCLSGDNPLFFPMIDFSLKEVGDKAQLHDVSGAIDYYCHVSAINRRAVNGKEFRELTVKIDGGQTNSWVEGVGAARDNWLTLFEQPTCMTGVAYSYMIACYQDGECLFTQNDFTVKGRPTPVMPEILNDGKSWIYEEDYYDFDKPERRSTLRFKLEVVGDTVIDGVLCRNLLRTCLNNDEIRQAHIGAFEYEHSVYKVEPGFYEGKPTIAPLMRFNYGQGDRIPLWDLGSDRYLDESFQLIVAEVNELNVNGVERTEYVLNSSNDPDNSVVNSWVEGVGAATNFWITQWPALDSPAYAMEYSGRLLECWQGDECIFTSKDFTHPVAGIEEVRSEATVADGAAYDLQGRRLAKPAPGQLYIRDGRLRRNW